MEPQKNNWRKKRLSEIQDRRVKLTSEVKDEIKNEYSTGRYSMRMLGRKYGVSHHTILMAVNPKSKKKCYDRVREYQKQRYREGHTESGYRKTYEYKKMLHIKGEL